MTNRSEMLRRATHLQVGETIASSANMACEVRVPAVVVQKVPPEIMAVAAWGGGGLLGFQC